MHDHRSVCFCGLKYFVSSWTVSFTKSLTSNLVSAIPNGNCELLSFFTYSKVLLKSEKKNLIYRQNRDKLHYIIRLLSFGWWNHVFI